MRKNALLPLVAALALLALPLPAADFGIGLDSLSSFQDLAGEVPVGFTEIIRLSAFFSFKAGKAFKMNAFGYGDSGYSTETGSFAFNANLDRLEMTLTPLGENAAAKLAVKAGRLRASDPAGLVGLSRIDGIQADFSAGQVDLGLDCGYLGLLSGQEMRILMSGPDIASYEAKEYLAPPRLYSALRFRYVELFAGQDLSAALASQVDLRQGQADLVHSEYGELLLEGPIALGFDYKLGGVFELIHRMAQDDTVDQAMGARLRLGWSEPALANSKANLTVDWASGTTGAAGAAGALSPFAPICSETAGESFDIIMSSILRYKAAYAFTPARGLDVGLFASGFMRAGEDEPEDPEYLPGATELWLGEEFGANLSWAPFSDFSLEAKGSCFLPAWGLTFQAEAEARWDASLSVSIDL